MKTQRLHISLWTLFRSLHSRSKLDHCWLHLQVFVGERGKLGWHKTLPFRTFCANTQQAAHSKRDEIILEMHDGSAHIFSESSRAMISVSRDRRKSFSGLGTLTFLGMLRENRLFRRRQLCEKKLQKFSLCSAGVLVASVGLGASWQKSGFSTGELLIHAIMFSGAFLCFISKPPWRVAITSAVSSLSPLASASYNLIHASYLVLGLWMCNHQHHPELCIQACTRQPIFLFHVPWFFRVLFGFSGFVFFFSTFFYYLCRLKHTLNIPHHTQQTRSRRETLFIHFLCSLLLQ